jgi:ATP-dependent Clp protease ATP-binding subunit ClpX
VDNIDKDNLLQYIILKTSKILDWFKIIGRLPVLTHMDPLDRATLRSILTEPKMRWSNSTKIILMDEVEFTITDEALDFIVIKH